jgi:putative membrane protein
MSPLHPGHEPSTWSLIELWPLAAILVLAAGYVTLASKRSREPRGWSGWRTAGFLTGCAVLMVGVVPQLSILPFDGFPAHMYQHLVIGMYAPLGLILGAPVTLALRSLPRRHGRLLGRVLRSRPVHLLANPVTALVLTLGGLVALYFTPLFAATILDPMLHGLVHVHFFAVGCLFAWVIAGPDPAPRRPGVPTRLVVLGIAIAGHAVIAQLIYAGAFVRVDAPAAELRAAGELMYYGGDIAELLLALALVTTWHPRRSSSRVVLQTAGRAATSH